MNMSQFLKLYTKIISKLIRIGRIATTNIPEAIFTLVLQLDE